MNKEQKLQDLYEFLAPQEGIFTREILDNYPQTLESYPKNWIDSLGQLSFQELFEFDARINFSDKLPHDLKEWWRKIDELTHFPRVSSSDPLFDDWSWHKVTEKKQHELSQIIKVLPKEKQFKVVELCAGVGHLSRLLSGHFNHQCTVIDFDRELLEKGQSRLNKYPLPHPPQVQFVHKDIRRDSISEVLAESDASIALHNCGDLSLIHLHELLKNKNQYFINVGCCYYKMPVIDCTNLSHKSKELNLPWTSIALYLATRAHYQRDIKDFKNKIQVKKFRYGLHLLLEKLSRNIKSVGEVPVRLYWGRFSDYALLKLNEHQIDHSFTEESLDSFFDNIETQAQINTMILANLIRWQLGRVLESYLILDRSLMLQDNGIKNNIFSLFDEQLSPRNLAIISQNVRPI